MWGTDYHGCYEKDIKSHSKNIIDLIEVGDYVNGEYVVEISQNKEIITEPYHFIKHIDNILTHEMYEQNCYKIGE